MPDPQDDQILRIKCTKFDLLWGAAPDSAGLSHSPCYGSLQHPSQNPSCI